MAVRSQATNQRPADRTARTGDQNSHRASLSARFAATRELFDLQSFLQQVADEHGDACSSPCFVDARPTNDDAGRYANDGNIGVRRTDSRNMQVQSKSRC
jgi:hypothetical protein